MALSAGAIAVLFLLSSFSTPAHAAGPYTMTLQTDSTSYSGSQHIKITGVISPAVELANTAVIVMVRNPAGGVVDINEVFPSPTNGSFTDISVPGGNSGWTSGTFSVNATWGGNGATVSAVVTFVYSPVATTTTTSSTITTTTTTTTSTTTTTTTTSSSTTTTSTTKVSTTVATSTTPEFPSSVLAIVALVGMALVAVLSRRVSLRPPGSMSR